MEPRLSDRSVPFPYLAFMDRERLPVHQTLVGVDDVTKLPRAPCEAHGWVGHVH